jgi:hypothetical protein
MPNYLYHMCPYPTPLPYSTYPYFTLRVLTVPYSTFTHPTLPYPTLPYLPTLPLRVENPPITHIMSFTEYNCYCSVTCNHIFSFTEQERIVAKTLFCYIVTIYWFHGT